MANEKARTVDNFSLTENEIGTILINTAIEIHRELGPGLLESVYEVVLVHELQNKAHRKQIQTYLRLTGLKLGYILNFGSALMRDGIVRAVNGLDEKSSPPSIAYLLNKEE
jgi:hypothetical protein